MIAYVETSWFLKLSLAESGSLPARLLWEQISDAFSSVALVPESFAALAAARRSKRLAALAHERAKREVTRLLEQIHLIDLEHSLASAAASLAERHALRGYDAVHLATALAVGGEETLVASSDQELIRAAQAVGLPIAGR